MIDGHRSLKQRERLSAIARVGGWRTVPPHSDPESICTRTTYCSGKATNKVQQGKARQHPSKYVWTPNVLGADDQRCGQGKSYETSHNKTKPHTFILLLDAVAIQSLANRIRHHPQPTRIAAWNMQGGEGFVLTNNGVHDVFLVILISRRLLVAATRRGVGAHITAHDDLQPKGCPNDTSWQGAPHTTLSMPSNKYQYSAAVVVAKHSQQTAIDMYAVCLMMSKFGI